MLCKLYGIKSGGNVGMKLTLVSCKHHFSICRLGMEQMFYSFTTYLLLRGGDRSFAVWRRKTCFDTPAPSCDL